MSDKSIHIRGTVFGLVCLWTGVWGDWLSSPAYSQPISNRPISSKHVIFACTPVYNNFTLIKGGLVLEYKEI